MLVRAQGTTKGMPIRLHPGRGCIVACPYRSLGMNLGRWRARTPEGRNRPGRRDGPIAFLRIPLAVRRKLLQVGGWCASSMWFMPIDHSRRARQTPCLGSKACACCRRWTRTIAIKEMLIGLCRVGSPAQLGGAIAFRAFPLACRATFRPRRGFVMQVNDARSVPPTLAACGVAPPLLLTALGRIALASGTRARSSARASIDNRDE